MNRTSKKGFTIVELVIVIAVIAILAAVLIPTFAGLINKANISADQQAVAQMNIVLKAEGVVNGGVDISEVKKILVANGFNNAFELSYAKHKLGYLKNESVVVLVDTDENAIVYPAGYEEVSIEADNTNFMYFNVVVVDTVEGFIEQIANVGADGSYSTIVLNNDISLSQEQTLTINDTAAVEIDLNGKTITAKGDALHVKGNGSLEISGGTINSGADAVYLVEHASIRLTDMTIINNAASNYSIVTNGGSSLDVKIVIENSRIEDTTGTGYVYLPAGDVLIKDSFIDARVCVSGGKVEFINTEFTTNGSSIAKDYRENEYVKAVNYIKNNGDGAKTFGDPLLIILNRGGDAYNVESVTVTNCKFSCKNNSADSKGYGIRIIDMQNDVKDPVLTINGMEDLKNIVKITNPTYDSSLFAQKAIFQTPTSVADYN